MMTTEFGTYLRGGERDREMIENPMRWPNIRLPLKNPSRYDTDIDRAFGVLVTGMTWPSEKRAVHIGNLFMPLGDETEEYENVDALLDAGWVVD
jgi:hypothetical protein